MHHRLLACLALVPDGIGRPVLSDRGDQVDPEVRWERREEMYNGSLGVWFRRHVQNHVRTERLIKTLREDSLLVRYAMTKRWLTMRPGTSGTIISDRLFGPTAGCPNTVIVVGDFEREFW